jgi:hypothetical protein
VAFTPFFFPADSLTPGANFAHEARCPGVGHRVHVRANFSDDDGGGHRADAEDLICRAAVCAKGATIASILASIASIRASSGHWIWSVCGIPIIVRTG